MARHATIAQPGTTLEQPRIRKIGVQHLGIAVQNGLDDFMATPTHVVFLCVIYPVVGLILVRLSFGYDVLPLLFPLAAGFALVGPLASVGLFELSRRREQGLENSWVNALDVRKSPSIYGIAALGLGLLVIFIAWLYAAQIIYGLTLSGYTPTSLNAFASEVVGTSAGQTLIVLGCGVGFVFAAAVLVIGLVSFPMLVDRNVSALTAVQTSIRVAVLNPVPVAMWGLFVTAVLIVGSIPVFIGLAIVMPILGHSTWHLYRQIVVPEIDAE